MAPIDALAAYGRRVQLAVWRLLDNLRLAATSMWRRQPDVGVGVDEGADTVWLATMHQPGLLDPTKYSDDWWAAQYAATDRKLEDAVAGFGIALERALGLEWAARVRHAEYVIGEWRHRVEAGCDDTTEWAVIEPRELVGAA